MRVVYVNIRQFLDTLRHKRIDLQFGSCMLVPREGCFMLPSRYTVVVE